MFEEQTQSAHTCTHKYIHMYTYNTTEVMLSYFHRVTSQSLSLLVHSQTSNICLCFKPWFYVHGFSPAVSRCLSECYTQPLYPERLAMAYFVAAVAGASSELTSGSLSEKEEEEAGWDEPDRSLASTSWTTAATRIWQVSKNKPSTFLLRHMCSTF